MTSQERRKVAAYAKMGVGAARMGSAIMTAAGHGLLGGFLRNHHMGRAAFAIGRSSFLGGKSMFEEGRRELDDANR